MKERIFFIFIIGSHTFKVPRHNMQTPFSRKSSPPIRHKANHFISYILFLHLLVFGTSCSKDDNQSMEIAAPLNCVYSGDLEFDQRTTDALSKYKRKSLQKRFIESK